jgi:hypothetical protein
MLNIKIYFIYINFINFSFSNNNQVRYLSLSPFYENLFPMFIKENSENNQELINLLPVEFQFNFLNFFLQNIISALITISFINFLIDEEFKKDKKHNFYINSYILFNSFILTLYLKFKYEDFIHQNSFEKFTFFITIIGFYFSIKEINYMFIKNNHQIILENFNKNILPATYKGDILNIFIFIFICYGNLYNFQELKKSKIKKIKKILLENSNEKGFYDNLNTRKVVNFLN